MTLLKMIFEIFLEITTIKQHSKTEILVNFWQPCFFIGPRLEVNHPASLIHLQSKFHENPMGSFWDFTDTSALSFYCVFWVFSYINNEHSSLKYCILTKFSQIVCLINLDILVFRLAKCDCKLWRVIWFNCVFFLRIFTYLYMSETL